APHRRPPPPPAGPARRRRAARARRAAARVPERPDRAHRGAPARPPAPEERPAPPEEPAGRPVPPGVRRRSAPAVRADPPERPVPPEGYPAPAPSVPWPARTAGPAGARWRCAEWRPWCPRRPAGARPGAAGAPGRRGTPRRPRRCLRSAARGTDPRTGLSSACAFAAWGAPPACSVAERAHGESGVAGDRSLANPSDEPPFARFLRGTPASSPAPASLILEVSTGRAPLTRTGEQVGTGRYLQDQRLPGGGPPLSRRR